MNLLRIEVFSLSYFFLFQADLAFVGNIPVVQHDHMSE